MGIISVASYKPLPGKDAELLAEVRTHVDILRGIGLATDRPSIAMRAKDGTLIEVFEWESQAAIDKAHGDPTVHAMWARFGACCEFVKFADLAEAADLFAGFEPLW